MTAAILLLAVVLLAPLVVLFVARPTRSVLPLYAFSIPAGSAFSLALPVPPPFDTVSSLLGGLALGACIAHVALYKDGKIPRAAVAMWIAFLGWAVITSFWAIDLAGSLKTLSAAVPLIFLLGAVSLLDWNKTDFDYLRVATIASGMLIGVYAFFLLATGSPLPTHGTGEGVRLSVISNSEDANPNILAASLLLPMALSLETVVTAVRRGRTARRWRWLGVSGFLMCLLGVLLTGSRGGIIAALVVAVGVLVTCLRIPELRAAALAVVRRVLLIIVTTAVLVSAGETIAPGVTSQVVAFSPIQRLFRSESSGRLAIWSTAYLSCKDYCGVGAGIGNFDNAYSLYFPYSGALGNIGINRPAHNIYLQLVVETGAVGIALLILALLLEYRTMSSRAVSLAAPSLRAGAAGILITEFFLTAIWFKFFWLMFIVVRAAERAGPQFLPAAPVEAEEEPHEEVAGALTATT